MIVVEQEPFFIKARNVVGTAAGLHGVISEAAFIGKSGDLLTNEWLKRYKEEKKLRCQFPVAYLILRRESQAGYI